MVRCKHCKKPVVKSSMASHFKICPEKKTKDKMPKKKDPKDGQAKPIALGNDDKDAEGAGDDSPTVKAAGSEAGHGPDGKSSAGNVIRSAKKSASKEAKTGTTDGSAKQTKKRKADMEGDKEPKKKKLKKDEPPKPKVAKPKGPVDVEKQCGVLLPNGGYCARSLTCKSHSMGAKRAVPGRSMPYDFLLAQYQKKNQAKQQSESEITIPTRLTSLPIPPCPFASHRNSHLPSPVEMNMYFGLAISHHNIHNALTLIPSPQLH